MENFLSLVAGDLRFLMATPPIQGIIRARGNGGVDPRDGSTEEVWKKRLATIFGGANGSKPSHSGNGKRSEPTKPAVVDVGEFDDNFEDF